MKFDRHAIGPRLGGKIDAIGIEKVECEIALSSDPAQLRHKRLVPLRNDRELKAPKGALL